MSSRMRIVAAWLLALLACHLPAAADDEAPNPVIPGTSTPVAALFRGMAWEFDVEEREVGDLLTLDWDGDGPAATRVVSVRMKSTEPHQRTSEGAVYLRFGLTAYRFESERIASQALEAFEDWQRRTAPSIRMRCKGAIYRAQVGPLVYVLTVGCQFSRRNYELFVERLEVALQEVQASDGRAIQCFCGGAWIERTLVYRADDEQ